MNHQEGLTAQVKTSGFQPIRWRWIGLGILADLIGLMATPGLNSAAHPIGTWIGLVLFPYATIIESGPFTAEITLAALPTYGVVLAFATRGYRWKVWFYSLAIFHTLSACIATKMYFGRIIVHENSPQFGIMAGAWIVIGAAAIYTSMVRLRK